mmetsp:Transcript_38585/g.90186  ORF Transcript_38585/g.90186 Transcript_38585/m.90186 type:complete len:134 (+) Transcript_38585:622-1023(+)
MVARTSGTEGPASQLHYATRAVFDSTDADVFFFLPNTAGPAPIRVSITTGEATQLPSDAAPNQRLRHMCRDSAGTFIAAGISADKDLYSIQDDGTVTPVTDSTNQPPTGVNNMVLSPAGRLYFSSATELYSFE